VKWHNKYLHIQFDGFRKYSDRPIRGLILTLTKHFLSWSSPDKMFLFLLLSIYFGINYEMFWIKYELVCFCFSAVGGSYCSNNYIPSVKIVTSPRLGPFRLGQTVEFTCEVDSSHDVSISYQWRSVEGVYGGGSTYSSRSFNKTFSEYRFTLRYCWYFCTVTYNGTFTVSNSKLIEVQGKQNSIHLVECKY